ncbi:hypothetical protein PGT21_036404 [Puccinia graminis f. sp. tritici]|uniref:Uncharacterized protein n=1 Tax=Puccinia graminis f. sp. tritici TaxID=56615 RepID=A0A5B0NQZ6_PUCGR|nr:hypothetical protein PGTUg99_037571 [Puccinia graminis f. sp. tritici]KAA1091635.1 hypothetical protein PGT21_036404 [Puccinia graminis f. sp. tritici]
MKLLRLGEFSSEFGKLYDIEARWNKLFLATLQSDDPSLLTVGGQEYVAAQRIVIGSSTYSMWCFSIFRYFCYKFEQRQRYKTK